MWRGSSTRRCHLSSGIPPIGDEWVSHACRLQIEWGLHGSSPGFGTPNPIPGFVFEVCGHRVVVVAHDAERESPSRPGTTGATAEVAPQWWVRGAGRWQYAIIAAEVVAVWTAVLLVMLGLGWLITEALHGDIDPSENDLSRWIADRRTPSLSDLAEIGATGGDTITICATAAVVAIGASVWVRSVRPLVFMVVGLLGQALVYDVCSRLVTRQRPPVKLLDHGLDPNASFPSGHVSTSVMFFGGCVALIWTYAPPRWRAVSTVLLLVPPIVAASRLYQGAHHATDALASLLVMPWWVVALCALILRSRFRPMGRSPSTSSSSRT